MICGAIRERSISESAGEPGLNADHHLDAAGKEATGAANQAAAEAEAALAVVAGMAERMAAQKAAAVETAGIQQGLFENVFVSMFADRVGEFALDWAQDKLDWVATIAEFVPVIGTVVARVANAVNAAISAARGDYVDAGLRLAFRFVPFGQVAGAVPRQGVQFAGLAFRG